MEYQDQYVPGECNIGLAQIKRRKRNGLIFAVLALLYLLYAFADGMDNLKVALFFVLSFVSAISFMQARRHFCVAHGLTGTEYFSKLSKAKSDDKSKSRQKDLLASGRIVLNAFAISLAITVVVFMVQVFVINKF